MSHFYFHIYEHGTLIWDEEGSECPDLDAAKREAMASATDLARQALARGEPAEGLCVEIRDEDDRPGRADHPWGPGPSPPPQLRALLRRHG